MVIFRVSPGSLFNYFLVHPMNLYIKRGVLRDKCDEKILLSS
jgi:hypothetical protein